MKKMMIHLDLAFMSAAIISSVVSIKFMSEINSNNIDFPDVLPQSCNDPNTNKDNQYHAVTILY